MAAWSAGDGGLRFLWLDETVRVTQQCCEVGPHR
jgi:hypothetical protein